MLGLYISLGVIALIIIILLAVFAYLHHGIFYSPLKGQNNDYQLTKSTQFLGIEEEINNLIKTLVDTPYEDVYVKSFDHLKLHGRYYENKNSHKVIIMFHGYRGTSRRDFSGAAMYLINKGLNVLLVDERGHGESQGHNITFGKREKKDVLSWINYIKERYHDNVEISLAGISMGAATILFAAQYIKEPMKLLCDCPYSTEKEIISETIKKLKLNVKFFYPIVNLVSIIYSRTSLNGDDASKSVKNSNHKVLIIHGDSDTIVPYQFSQRIYLENKEKVRYELFPNTEHGVSYVTDTPRYQKILDDFLAD